MIRRIATLLISITLILTISWFVVGCKDDVQLAKSQVQIKEPEKDIPTMQVDTQDPDNRVDEYKQKNAVADILWVVDNSRSMKEEQDSLAENFDNFIQFILETQVDYHIGVIKTEILSGNSGCAVPLHGTNKIISSEMTPEVAKQYFTENIKVGIEGGALEKGIDAASIALSEPCISGANAGFLRNQASLFIIFVSDEDDSSYGSIRYHTRFFKQLKGIGNDNLISLSCIVGTGTSDCPTAAKGTRYIELADLTGGDAMNICAPFSEHLGNLGVQASGLRRFFFLSKKPVVETILVTVDNENISENPSSGYLYIAESNEIQFGGSYVPPPGSTIRISYKMFSQ